MRMAPALIALTLAIVACSPGTISRTEWQRMPHEERVLYVQSLVGEERARAAKGGAPARHTRPAEEYVRAIDAAYASGDARAPREIFAQLAH